jgi:hypothetical protein
MVLNEQYGIINMYEETKMTKEQAFETIDRIVNSNRRFYTFEETIFNFATGYDNSNTTRLDKVIKSVNINKLTEINFREIYIEE